MTLAEKLRAMEAECEPHMDTGCTFTALTLKHFTDAIAALERHRAHIEVHDRACCRELEAEAEAVLARVKQAMEEAK